MERLFDLKAKEVIDICDGRRLGFVCDCEFDFASGQLCSIIVPKSSGLFNREEYIIPWRNIRKVGNDIIIVDTHDARAL